MTVEEHFKAEFGDNWEEVLLAAQYIDPAVPDRYKQLCREVVLRLPADWDEYATWDVQVNWDESPRGYANVLREEEGEGSEEDAERIYSMTIYPAMLDRLSDEACRWVFAHEFGHIASGLATGSLTIKGKPYTRIKGTVDLYDQAPEKKQHEDSADEIAMGWGFDPAAFLDGPGGRQRKTPPVRS